MVSETETFIYSTVQYSIVGRHKNIELVTMNTITVKELLQNFENQEFVQIYLPKKTVTKQFGWRFREVEEDIPEDTVLHMRSEVQNIDHFNEVYKDGDKYYLEDESDACERICRRAFGKDGYDVMNDFDNASYCLYLAKGDLREAVKIMKRRYC